MLTYKNGDLENFEVIHIFAKFSCEYVVQQ